MPPSRWFGAESVGTFWLVFGGCGNLAGWVYPRIAGRPGVSQ